MDRNNFNSYYFQPSTCILLWIFGKGALGIILGLIYYYSESIWLNVLFHFLFNGIQVTVLYESVSSAYALNKKIADPNLSPVIGG